MRMEIIGPFLAILLLILPQICNCNGRVDVSCGLWAMQLSIADAHDELRRLGATAFYLGNDAQCYVDFRKRYFRTRLARDCGTKITLFEYGVVYGNSIQYKTVAGTLKHYGDFKCVYGDDSGGKMSSERKLPLTSVSRIYSGLFQHEDIMQFYEFNVLPDVIKIVGNPKVERVPHISTWLQVEVTIDIPNLLGSLEMGNGRLIAFWSPFDTTSFGSEVFHPEIALCRNLRFCPSVACPPLFQFADHAVFRPGDVIHMSIKTKIDKHPDGMASNSFVSAIEEMTFLCEGGATSSALRYSSVTNGCTVRWRPAGGKSVNTDINFNTQSDVICISVNVPPASECKRFVIKGAVVKCAKGNVKNCFDYSGSMCLKRLPDIGKFTLGPFYILPKDSGRADIRYGTAVSESSSITSHATNVPSTSENIQVNTVFETEWSMTENVLTDEASTITTSSSIDSDDILVERSAVLSGIDKRKGIQSQIVPATLFEFGKTPTPSQNSTHVYMFSHQNASNATDTVFKSTSTATVAGTLYGDTKRQTGTQITPFHDIDGNGETAGDIRLDGDISSSSDQYRESVESSESLTMIHLLNSVITGSPESSLSRSGSGSEYQHSGNDHDDSERRDSRLSHNVDIDVTPSKTATGDLATENARHTASTTHSPGNDSLGNNSTAVPTPRIRHTTSSQSVQVGSPHKPKQKGLDELGRSTRSDDAEAKLDENILKSHSPLRYFSDGSANEGFIWGGIAAMGVFLLCAMGLAAAWTANRRSQLKVRTESQEMSSRL